VRQALETVPTPAAEDVRPVMGEPGVHP
jgi:hypothetical protein